MPNKAHACYSIFIIEVVVVIYMCSYINMETVLGAYARELVVFDEWNRFLNPLFFVVRKFNKLIIKT